MSDQTNQTISKQDCEMLRQLLSRHTRYEAEQCFIVKRLTGVDVQNLSDITTEDWETHKRKFFPFVEDGSYIPDPTFKHFASAIIDNPERHGGAYQLTLPGL